MNKLPNHALATVAFLTALLCVAGCQSNPQPKNANSNADLQALAAKQKEYDQLLEEWKTLKPGLSRLLSIEGELNLLLGQLEQLSSTLEESQGPTAIASAYVSPAAAPSPAPIAKAEPLPADAELVTAPISTYTQVADTYSHEQEVTVEETPAASDANFALQVASITDMRRLPVLWQEMMDKNRQLLSSLEPNFQKTQVNNTDYYRLKLGAFSTKQEASRKCNELKTIGVTCIVADYNSSNFAQLSDYQDTSLTAQNLLNTQRN